MDRRILPRRVPPVGLVAAPARAAHRPGRQVAQRAVEGVLAVEDAVGRDPGAEIPPGKALRALMLDRRALVRRLQDDGRILDAAVEEGAMGIVVRPRSGGEAGAQRQPLEHASGARHLGRAGIEGAPAALQGGLAEVQLAVRRDHPQLVPAPLQHRRRDLHAPAARLQHRALGRNAQRQPVLDREYGLAPPVEQPGLHPNHNRARIGQRDRPSGGHDAYGTRVDRLGAGGVLAGECSGHFLQFDARPGRVGIGMDDPHQVGPVGSLEPAGNLDCDTLAGTARETVDIADQRHHHPSLRTVQRQGYAARSAILPARLSKRGRCSPHPVYRGIGN